MASAGAAGKPFGNITETVRTLKFFTDITLAEKSLEGGERGPRSGGGGRGGVLLHQLTQPVHDRARGSHLKIADINLKMGGVDAPTTRQPVSLLIFIPIN